jgi:hypothetical protein
LEVEPKMMFACFEFIHQLAKFEKKKLELSKRVICIFETRALKFIEKEVNKRNSVNRLTPSLCGPALCQTGPRRHQLAQGPLGHRPHASLTRAQARLRS